ncbi:MAG TPA: ATP-binding protein [Steroidobacteraceae bacterium]|jgi:anti-sigma regulatory factor (Ser/Thr protein kinase)
MAPEASSQCMMPATLAGIEALQRWLVGLTAEWQLPASLAHRLDLCLTESVSNVIAYGYPRAAAGTVSIVGSRDSERIVVRIDDDGTAFDPTRYVPPELPQSLGEASIGGRGIRLVRHFADEIHYRRLAAQNQLTLVFRCADSRKNNCKIAVQN